MHHKPNPVQTLENLRDRIDRLFRTPRGATASPTQGALDFAHRLPLVEMAAPADSVTEFLNFLVDALPTGDVYLFGGLLRDVALFGIRGFDSDVDVVIEGSWAHCITYLESRGAEKNKFGGYRLSVGGWPVDVWRAEDTWAIAQHLVPYKGISSLTETTVLNWDAILMNWRDRSFIYRKGYFEALAARVLDVVLRANPNPLGMATRVFRHLCLKDARKLTPQAARYLAESAARYSFDIIRDAELRSYGNAVIEPSVYRLFEHIDLGSEGSTSISGRYSIAADTLKRELGLS